MGDEYTVLINNKTQHLVPPSPTMNVIGNKWVFRIKRKANGSIKRYKARLIAKGFHQNPGVNSFETFSL